MSRERDAQPTRAAGPQCIYGQSCFAVCINSSCRKPGLICQNGFYNKDECGLFHQGCEKVRWSDIQNAVYNNPLLSSPEFSQIHAKIESMFISIIQKIRQEHNKFKIWVKTYGHSIEVMKFIKSLTEQNYGLITRAYMNPILAELSTNKKIEIPSIVDAEVSQIHDQLIDTIDRISQLYLRPGSKKERSERGNTSMTLQPKISLSLNSRITQDLAAVTKLFDNKIASFKLLYRASQNAFSIKEFHRRCDGTSNTLTLVETQFGKIIGGFTVVEWNSIKKQWAADKSMKSFIFSLSTREKFHLNLAQFAIANNPDKGPIFGCCDICLVDNSNRQRSNAEFPISYNNGKYVRSSESSFAFTGHPKGQFLVKEWQVFRVEFQ